MESRHPQNRDADEYDPRLLSQSWEPAAPTGAGSSAPSQSSGMTCPRGLPGEDSPAELSLNTTSVLVKSLKGRYGLVHAHNSIVIFKVNWL